MQQTLTRPALAWRTGLDTRRFRLIAIAITIGIFAGIVMSNALLWPVVVDQMGVDLNYFRFYAGLWLDGRGFYLPTQLEGPYEADVGYGNYYPPTALFLLAPFVDLLPAPLWWAIPLGITAWCIWSWKPAYWTWPVMALLVWLPRDGQILIWGNTALWIQALVALGLRFGWPAALIVLIKPSMLPLALIGIHKRSWWVTLIAGLALSIPLLPLWFDYLTIMANNVGDWPTPIYYVHDYGWLLLPVVAWLGRPVGLQVQQIVEIAVRLRRRAGTGRGVDGVLDPREGG